MTRFTFVVLPLLISSVAGDRPARDYSVRALELDRLDLGEAASEKDDMMNNLEASANIDVEAAHDAKNKGEHGLQHGHDPLLKLVHFAAHVALDGKNVALNGKAEQGMGDLTEWVNDMRNTPKFLLIALLHEALGVLQVHANLFGSNTCPHTRQVLGMALDASFSDSKYAAQAIFNALHVTNTGLLEKLGALKEVVQGAATAMNPFVAALKTVFEGMHVQDVKIDFSFNLGGMSGKVNFDGSKYLNKEPDPEVHAAKQIEQVLKETDSAIWFWYKTMMCALGHLDQDSNGAWAAYIGPNQVCPDCPQKYDSEPPECGEQTMMLHDNKIMHLPCEVIGPLHRLIQTSAAGDQPGFQQHSWPAFRGSEWQDIFDKYLDDPPVTDKYKGTR